MEKSGAVYGKPGLLFHRRKKLVSPDVTFADAAFCGDMGHAGEETPGKDRFAGVFASVRFWNIVLF